MQAYIKSKGVTKCPPTGSPELFAHHQAQDQRRRSEYERRTGHKVLTEEQKLEKRRAYADTYQRKKKEMI